MSKLSIGIVGLPNVGKSTLFNLLTKQQVNTANYPFATVNPNVGVVEVPDVHLEQVARVSKAEKVVSPIVEFYDIAGLVRGAHRGEGLGNQFLSQIRETRILVHIIRCFPSGDIVHVEGDVNPIRDLESVHTELILKDLETAGKRMEKLEKEAKSGDKNAMRGLDLVKKAISVLNEGKLISSMGDVVLEEPVLKELNLLTAKPQLYLLNGTQEEAFEALRDRIRELGGEHVVLDLVNEENFDDLIKSAYEMLDLITFYTIESGETRGWTVRRGSTAPQAGGEIHTDFQEKFIKADVINWEDLVASGGWNGARGKGLIRTEGKHYVVQDGDVLLIKHG